MIERKETGAEGGGGCVELQASKDAKLSAIISKNENKIKI